MITSACAIVFSHSILHAYMRSLYVCQQLIWIFIALERNCWMHFPVNRLSTTHTADTHTHTHNAYLEFLPSFFLLFLCPSSLQTHTHTHKHLFCTFHSGKSYTINFHVVNVFGTLNQKRWFIFAISFLPSRARIKRIYLNLFHFVFVFKKRKKRKEKRHETRASTRWINIFIMEYV